MKAKALQQLQQIRNAALRLTRRQWLFAGGGFVVAFGLTVMFMGYIPRAVALNYDGETCTSVMTPLPGVYTAVDDDAYSVDLTDVVTLAGIDILSRQTCFTPQQAPKASSETVAAAPWGGAIGRKVYKITSDEPPSIKSAVFDKAIPTTRPLTVPLEAPDKLHQYQIAVNQQSAKCDAVKADLKCDIEELQLKQGERYDFELKRQFASVDVGTVAKGELETLRAIEITERSITNDQVVYDKPQSFTFAVDKPVQSAKGELSKGDDSIPLDISTDGASITLSLTEELERRADYTLKLQSIEAQDGATLIEPEVVNFYVSDGPLVSGVSVGSSRVALNQSIILSFDQPLAEQDLAKHIAVEGVSVGVSRYSPTQALVQITAADRCAPFTIRVAKGLKSEHDIESTQDWRYTSRTICHTTSVYGTSHQGRALIAYHFGNSGPVTMYVGAIHGNESSCMGILQSWINELEANPSRIGNRQIVIIPNINPDGIAAGTRANAHKVNLNRNFPTSNWVSDIKDTDGSHKGGGGSSPLSEPEAKALADITSRYRPRLLVSYHAIGSLVVGDPGGYSAGKAAQYAGMVGYRNATGMSSTFDYDITGAYEDWTYRNLGIPSMIVELGSYSYHNFAHHRAAFWAMLD